MKQTIQQAITDILSTIGISEVSFVVEHPTDISHGDYSCNVAMVLAKQLQKNPREIASMVVDHLEGKIDGVNKIEVAGPGFVNFFLTRDFFSEKITLALTQKDHWGKNTLLENQQILVEYTDPNPFKEFHIGHLFTNTVGEAISRLIEFSGAQTKRLCYQGDVGMHVAKSIYGMQKLGMTTESNLTARDMGKAYATGATAYKDDAHAQEEIKTLNKKIYNRSDEVINDLYDKGREVSLAYFEEIYHMVGTSFDEYFFESEAGPKGREIVLEHPEVFVDSNGAKVFDGEQYGLHTRVFINSEGLPTYEAKELALAKMKEDRLGTYDLSIISTSNEITEYFKVLKKAMSFVYPELEKKTEHIGHGTVRLTSGKMSSRTGEVISALDFIQEIAQTAKDRMKDTSPDLAENETLVESIAISAIKYAILKGNILQDTVFDKTQALSFEGASGPYLQYTHARIHSVVQKAQSAGVEQGTNERPATPYDLEKILYRFPEVVEEAMRERAPHKVATYLTELAGLYNTFYAKEKIADASDVYAPYKVSLSQAVAQTLKNGLWVLGIDAPERM